MNLSSLFKFKRQKSNIDSELRDLLVSLEGNLFSELNKEIYCWSKSDTVKKYNCFIFSKFLISYSFRIAYQDLDKNTLNSFSKKVDDVFADLHDERYSGLLHKDMKSVVDEKCSLFHSVRKENKPPECWHLIYSSLTGKSSLNQIYEDVAGLKKAIKLLGSKKSLDSIVEKFNSMINVKFNQIESFDLAEILFRQNIRLIKKQLISLDVLKQLSSKK